MIVYVHIVLNEIKIKPVQYMLLMSDKKHDFSAC